MKSFRGHPLSLSNKYLLTLAANNKENFGKIAVNFRVSGSTFGLLKFIE